MMVALLLYAYATGERSSRRIERKLTDDVAFRVIAANQILRSAAEELPVDTVIDILQSSVGSGILEIAPEPIR